MKPVFIKSWADKSSQFCRIKGKEWNISRLIDMSKELEVIEIPLRHLDLGILQKAYEPREFVMHMRAVLEADLRYPIILDENGEIMDGRHRILKALHLNKKTIKAVRFDENPSPCNIISEDG